MKIPTCASNIVSRLGSNTSGCSDQYLISYTCSSLDLKDVWPKDMGSMLPIISCPSLLNEQRNDGEEEIPAVNTVLIWSES